MATKLYTSHDNAFPAAVIAQSVAIRAPFKRTTRAEVDALFANHPEIAAGFAAAFDGLPPEALSALHGFATALADYVERIVETEYHQYITSGRGFPVDGSSAGSILSLPILI